MAGGLGDILSGAFGGAIAGAPLGPWGIAGGAGLGGLAGYATGNKDEKKDLSGAFKEVSNRYAQYRPEDFARRKEAIKYAMSMMAPSHAMLQGAYGVAPPNMDAFFQPPAGGQSRPPMTGRGTYQGAPRGGPGGGPIKAGPSGTPPQGPPPPMDPWKGVAT